MLFFLPLAALLLFWRAPIAAPARAAPPVHRRSRSSPSRRGPLRNAVVHQRFVPIASEGGVTFWTGNHREAIGEGDLAANPHLKLRNAGVPGRARRPLGGAARAALLPRGARASSRADPVWWLGLEARKLWYTLVPFGPSYRLHAPRYFWASAVSLLLAAAVRRSPGLSGRRPGRGRRPLLALAASTIAGRPGVLPARALPAARHGPGAHRRRRAARVARMACGLV